MAAPLAEVEENAAPRVWRVQALGAALATVGRAALNLVYPPTCPACRAATAAPDALCACCWREMRFIERPFCERLGTPFGQDFGPGLISPQAAADPPVF